MIFYKENSIFIYEPIQEKPVITLEEIENFPEWNQLKNHPRIIQWKENS